MDLYIFIFYMDRERGRFEPWLSAVLVVVGQSVNVFPPKLHAHVSVEAGERNVEAERIDREALEARLGRGGYAVGAFTWRRKFKLV